MPPISRACQQELYKNLGGMSNPFPYQWSEFGDFKLTHYQQFCVFEEFSGSVMLRLARELLAFQPRLPTTDCDPTLNLYWVRRRVLGSYWKASESLEPSVTAVGWLAVLSEVVVRRASSAGNQRMEGSRMT